ncbi:MAG: amino acid ABC transporter permease [Candidatus Tectomicrobia bacterium]|uniref:Amino acid ABC transporter permease n=1 Tax=Tectimicrobiota bacterium TaxID=2528274 RepID=A0A937VYH8_UNCTE|nr:amino acid ABC transporter permease [Candidatus Tectomicrobia bacterium]
MVTKPPAPILPPPQVPRSLIRWLHTHLFSSWWNAVLSLALALGLAGIVQPAWHWLVTVAHWQAITVNLRLFTVGLYPSEQLWRPGALLILLAFLCGGSAAVYGDLMWRVSRTLLLGCIFLACLLTAPAQLIMGGAALALLAGYALGRYRCPHRWGWQLGWCLSLPVVLLGLGGVEGTGLVSVSSTQWGGLLLTLLLAAVGIVASFPLGLLLALGRQSTLPVIRWSAIAYIELVRGVPLISVLMMFAVLLPLFLPASWGRPNMLLRILVGMTLFTAAYIAENVRGGLQAIPRGQYEAATALGLTWLQSMRHIILPQALRAVIPALVGQCISLFKDTSLATIIGSLELLGIAKTVIEQADWKSVTGGVVFEVFIFTALIYGVFTYSMSRLSRRLEHVLGVGTR